MVETGEFTFLVKVISLLVSLALIQQGTELLVIRKYFSNQGLWRWTDLAGDFVAFPNFARPIFTFLFKYEHFMFLIIAQIILAALFAATQLGILPFLLFMSAMLISMRFRGAYNGGSDYLTLIILTGLCFASAVPAYSLAALWYIAVQVGLSYFVAGLVKLKEPRWRNGTMLRDFFLFSNYTIPGWLRTYLSGGPRKNILLVCSWVVILFECSFPMAFISREVCLIYLGMGFVFHLSNAYVLGLNRFLFVWISAYPAVYALAGYRWSSLL